MKSKKKVFPKLKKKLSSFLTDESGKMSKKDALGLVAGAVLLSGVDEVAAGHSNTYVNKGNRDWWGDPSCSHTSGIVNGHFSQTSALSGHHEGQKTLYTGHNSHSSS